MAESPGRRTRGCSMTEGRISAAVLGRRSSAIVERMHADLAMTKNSALFAGVTAIIVVAIMGPYLYIGDDRSDSWEYNVGDVLEYNVFGFTESGDAITGTAKSVVLDMSDTQHYSEYVSDIYTIDRDGVKTPLDVGTYRMWQDKLSSSDYDVRAPVTADTFWGGKTLRSGNRRPVGCSS